MFYPYCVCINQKQNESKIINNTPETQKFHIIKEDSNRGMNSEIFNKEYELAHEGELEVISQELGYGSFPTVYIAFYPPNYRGGFSRPYRIKIFLKEGTNFQDELIKKAQSYRYETKDTEDSWLFQPPYVW